MILITGNTGYIGTVMTRLFQEKSYDVSGLDSNYFKGCELYPPEFQPSKQIVKDIRAVTKEDLRGVTTVIHLAGLSNDPLGEINTSLTHDINYVASLRLAELAKKQGVEKFIFSSSCSLYGIASNDRPMTEEGDLMPVTAYAKSKVNTETGISRLADKDFHPVFMRNATVYGVSPSLRLDLVVNNLTAWAYLTGKVSVMSDGTPWRPLVHVEDVCRAFIAVTESVPERIHNQAFNVGINEENYQVVDVANMIEDIVPDCEVEILNKTGPDERTYRVDFSKINSILHGFSPVWNVRKGIEELLETYKGFGLNKNDLESSKYFRLRWIKYLLESKRLNTDLKWNQ